MYSKETDPFNDNEELLLRQIHPSFIQEGRVTSQAFRPTPKDQKKLSVNRGSMISPGEAYRLHTEKKGLSSNGVFGISVGEVKEIEELNIQEDPVMVPVEDISHCLIDFSGAGSDSRIKAVSSKLADKARKRGFLYSSTGE